MKIVHVSAFLALSSSKILSSNLLVPLALMKEREGGGRPFLIESRSEKGIYSSMSGIAKDGCQGDILIHGHIDPQTLHKEAPLLELAPKLQGEFTASKIEDGCVFAVRDSIGARPLYWGVSSSTSGVCSETNPLRAYGIDPIPVPPGHIVKLQGPKANVTRFDKELTRKAFNGSLDKAVDELYKLIDYSLTCRVKDVESIAIAFSGGLDSSILAAISALHHKVILVSVFAAGSPDSHIVNNRARSLGLELITREVGKAEVMEALDSIKHYMSMKSPMDRALVAGFFLTSVAASKSGFKVLMTGQGADELFAGYNRYLKLAESDLSKLIEALRNDFSSFEKGLRRDETAIAYGGCEACFPFADRSLAEFTFNLPSSFLISNGTRKIVLRALAKKIGLPTDIVDAGKKAFQFSSGLEKLLK